MKKPCNHYGTRLFYVYRRSGQYEYPFSAMRISTILAVHPVGIQKCCQIQAFLVYSISDDIQRSYDQGINVIIGLIFMIFTEPTWITSHAIFGNLFKERRANLFVTPCICRTSGRYSPHRPGHIDNKAYTEFGLRYSTTIHCRDVRASFISTDDLSRNKE